MSVLGRGSVFVAAFAAVLGVGLMAEAQQRPPADIIAARQQAMKTLGAEMKGIGDAAKAGSITKEDASARASKINEIANQMVSWFPAGTGPESGVKTAALPAIWEKPADYKAAIDRFAGESAKLVAAANTGNAATIAAAQGEVGKSCGGCHQIARQRN
ncbi:cytochrome c556 [Stella humosa]|uniref:Cytochrome c556 n=1 Tax=Stella humosa TaxID=94 RepID=A0A3N1M6B5_9PROT|nr:cytochrome c [Stella humosa]ROQ01372.1 cytochrome c556 [Stella humosa]BBK31746.1 cytochrome c [Stella humosa]